MHIANIEAPTFKKFKGRSFLPKEARKRIEDGIEEHSPTHVEIEQPFNYHKGELSGEVRVSLHTISDTYHGTLDVYQFKIEPKKLAKIVAIHTKK